jgi:hypothetical protein
MPVFENRIVVEITRKLRVFLNVEAGITGLGETIRSVKPRRIPAPAKQGSEPPPDRTEGRKNARREESGGTAAGDGRSTPGEKLKEARQQIAARDRQIAGLRKQLAEQLAANRSSGNEAGGIKPENLIWIFGVARTGSSWLSSMMADIEGYSRWNEPYVGDVFGYAYFIRAWDWQRERSDYILGDAYKETWLGSIRTFVLQGAAARFPEAAAGGYLVVKEPNGSIGAPLLAEALPESRMIFLVRDPRDVVSSLMAAQKKEGWAATETRHVDKGDVSADDDPDEFVRTRAHLYMASLEKARLAYDNHPGPKVAVRYEDIRYDTLDELRRIYAGLGVPAEDEQLRRVAEKHAWENVPEDKKGPDKPRRKAKPGGWREDLTPQQVETVEKIAAPVLEEFYAENGSRAQS